MLETLFKFSFFIGIGFAWRFTKPMGISADALRSSLLNLLYLVFLPALVLSILWNAKLGANTWRILLVMLFTTGISLAAAWYYYKRINLSNNIKGSFILAAAFGSVLVIGAPVTQAWVSNWTIRTAVYFEAIIMLPVLFTIGLLLVKKLGSYSKGNIGLDIIKEPILITVILGLILNLANVKMPMLVANWLNITKSGVLPIGLIVIGLSLYWNKQWYKLIPVILPATIIQLILMPIILWAFFHIFGVSGVQTFKSTFIQAAMPSMVFGFIICEKYRLDTNAYTAVFSFTTVISLITLPVWWTLLKNGVIS